MNENLNLVEILKGCPKGTKFYSSAFGEVVFQGIIEKSTYPICFKLDNEEDFRYVTSGGKLYYSGIGECIIFPSRTQRDWSKFERFWDKPKVEKFDVNTLQPFDKILARDYQDELWSIELFSHKTGNIVRGLCHNWCYAIPFNENTKHLIGTREDCPDYYKWWEE